MFLKSAGGDYEPSFFIIRLDTDRPLDKAVEENLPTFVHEYLHLLQDLILPYCIRENLVRLGKFFDYVDRARTLGEIRLPIPELDGEKFVNLQTRITWGASKDPCFVPEVSSIQRIDRHETFVEDLGYSLWQYDLVLEGGKIYQFGARDLLEYIAHKIEIKHFPAQEKFPDLPYFSLDLVLRYFELDSWSDVKRIAVAEHCLLNDNPANQLFFILENLDSSDLAGIFDAPDQDFVRLLRKLSWKSNGVPFETISQKLDRRSRDLKDRLKARFPENAFPAIYSWLDSTLTISREKLAGRSLFAELHAMETPVFNAAITDLLQQIGVPLIVNDCGEMGTSLGGDDEKDQFLQLLLAYEFLEYLRSQDAQCPMCTVCETQNPEIMDQDCMDAPFRRAKEDELCPFGAFAKTHGLADVHWYVNGKIVPSQGSQWP